MSPLSSRRLKIYAYDMQADGALANKRLHCELGPDGMTLNTERNLYLTGNGVIVFYKMGKANCPH